ncbi:hypothetical protein V8G54_020423 [Vigna mungo]|uniref:Disease resistance protein At4g27190-like leucine-rich repeats domain-containing protein n=1 Tax=Vigna mungo TaxID=3915 RepID=A0AAQ3NCB4_VIGMU
MDVKERSTFSIGVLDENEAKTLLKKVVGIHIQNFAHDEKSIEIARMCDGLPIALVSIGRTLKNKSSFVWEDVYEQMKRQSYIEGKEPIEFSIKLSYDHLENELLKFIFLRCARMGNDALVMDFVKFCIGLGLLQGVHTIREARNKVNMLMEELKESSLLLEIYSSNRFNMHDIVRDVALSISSKEKQNLVFDELDSYKIIFGEFNMLTEGDFKIPDKYEMVKLLVLIPKLERLELSSINIQKIWSDQSQHSFKNLLTLDVRDYGNLKYLLSFSMAKHLQNLQSLFVGECEMMEDIFCPEDVEGNIDCVFPKLKKMEIMCMEKLNTIWQSHISLHSFSKLGYLIIRECHKLETIFPSFMRQRFQNLQSLTITNCKLVENIFDFANISQTCDKSETNLHNIVLQGLPNLVSIWKDDTGEILKHNNLQSIKIIGSPNLKYVFPLSVTYDLENLESLEVFNCRTMKEIVASDKGSNENVFSHLKTVSLRSLFELESFYLGTHTLEWPSLKNLSILRCGKLEGITTKISNSQAKPIVLATEKGDNSKP